MWNRAEAARVQFHHHALGEDFTYYVHFSGAGAFVVCSIGPSLVFALREVYYVMNFDAPDAESNKSPRRRFWGYVALAGVTGVFGLAAVAGNIGLGFTIGGIDNVWLGELGAFTAFAISWLLAGRLRAKKL